MRGELQHATGSQSQDRDEALAAFGLVLEDPIAEAEPDIFCLWPEHVEVLDLWFGVQTQWRHGFNAPTGLDYCGVEALMRQRRVRKPRARFAALQVMERAALAEWARMREAKSS